MSELNLTHSNGNKVKLATPDTLSANRTFKLPGADGSAGEFLKTDGSGAFSFGAGGKVLQCKTNYDSSMITVSNTSGNQGSSFGLNSLRVYGNLNEITITPVSSSSTMILQGISGCTNSPASYPSQGAYGIVCVLNDSSAGAIDNTDYNAYQLRNLMGTSGYLPFLSCQGHYAAGSTSQQVWRLKGYAYTEGSNTCTIRFIKHHLTVWEVEI